MRVTLQGKNRSQLHKKKRPNTAVVPGRPAFAPTDRPGLDARQGVRTYCLARTTSNPIPLTEISQRPKRLAAAICSNCSRV